MNRYERSYITRLTERFGAPPSPIDPMHPVSYASRLIRRGYPVLFDVHHLAHVTGTAANILGLIQRDPSSFYSLFVVRKRGGGSREIAAPSPELKRVQQWINRFIAQRFPIHDAAHGFRRGRSIATNAALHVGAEAVLALDLRDFFGTVPKSVVYRRFREAGYSKGVADLLTRLVTLRGHLPQGAPTSPAIANSAAHRLDSRLAGFATRRSVAYSRYADDLAFSGPAAIIHGSRFKRTVEKILRDSRFPPQDEKTRYMDQSARQKIAGLIVNVVPNAPRERRRWLRQELYYLEKFGVEDHLSKRDMERPRYREFIYGHVVALFVSNPDEAAGYLRRLDALAWK
jgi:RNA-directed DNA polymerase